MLHHRFIAPLLVTALSFASGCEFLEQFEDGGGLVDVFVTHTGTASDGAFPSQPGDHLVLKGDKGWEILVVDAYVTTSSVTLQKCDGTSLPAELYWGPSCEDLIGHDRETQGVGTVTADEGSYCSIAVTYGPLAGGDQGHGDTDVESAQGATVYLSGLARRGNAEVPFEVSTTSSLTIEVDLSSIDGGGPFTMNHDEYFNKQLTIAKTYDRFFDGIDFKNLEDYDWDAILLDTLEFETTAHLGTDVLPQ